MAIKKAIKLSAIFLGAFLLLAILFHFSVASIFARTEKIPKKVLLLYSDNQFLPVNMIMEQTISKILKNSDIFSISLYSEYLEVNRFKSESIQKMTMELLKEKYSGYDLDLVMVMDDISWDFIAQYGDELFPGLPFVFCSITEGKLKAADLKSNVTGNFKSLDIKSNIEIILKVQPDVEEIVVITGTSKQDLFYKDAAKNALQEYTQKIKVTLLEDFSIDEVQKKLASLPARTAVFFVSFNMDGEGKAFIPLEVVLQLSKVSRAPIYGMYDTFIGKGILGGNLISYADISENASGIALQILSGKKPSEIQAVTSKNKNYFDWNEMKRWGIKEADLPAGSIVINKNLSTWDLYKWQIITAIVFIISETLLIIFLLLQLSLKKAAELKLNNLNVRLVNILEGTNVGTWEWNVQTGETVFSDRWAEIIGYKLAEISPVSIETWERFAHPDDINKSNEQLGKVFSEEIDYYDVECRMRHKDGSWVWVHDRGKVISRTPDEKPLWMSGTHADINKRKKAEEALRESAEKFSKAFKTSSYAITITSVKDGKFIEVNDAFASISGFTGEEAIADSSISLNMWVNNENREMVVSALKEGTEVKDKEFQFRKKNGEVIICLFSAQIIHINSEAFILSSINDITERKKAEDEIIYLGFHDYMTGLYNRRFFEEELKRLDTERHLPISFIMCDLNGLKIINDVFGHTEGDKLLKKTAEIFKKVCRPDDILAHWGGDEFVLLLPETAISDTEEIVGMIKKECAKTNSQKIPVSISIGTSRKERPDEDIQTVVIDAESNMYKNKLAQKESLTSSIIFALEQALYEKSNETKEHADRMHDFATKLGKSIKLPAHQLDELALLASLHDIGKVAIPEKILLKKGKLTEKEWAVIKRHPEIGYNIAQSSQQISHIAKSILSCHENFDGSGYPLGISGDSIPVISRIILIVDAYDVMTSGRVYKPAMSREDAIAELKRCAGTQFDPRLVDKAIEILSK